MTGSPPLAAGEARQGRRPILSLPCRRRSFTRRSAGSPRPTHSRTRKEACADMGERHRPAQSLSRMRRSTRFSCPGMRSSNSARHISATPSWRRQEKTRFIERFDPEGVPSFGPEPGNETARQAFHFGRHRRVEPRFLDEGRNAGGFRGAVGSPDCLAHRFKVVPDHRSACKISIGFASIDRTRLPAHRRKKRSKGLVAHLDIGPALCATRQSPCICGPWA